MPHTPNSTPIPNRLLTLGRGVARTVEKTLFQVADTVKQAGVSRPEGRIAMYGSINGQPDMLVPIDRNGIPIQHVPKREAYGIKSARLSIVDHGTIFLQTAKVLYEFHPRTSTESSVIIGSAADDPIEENPDYPTGSRIPDGYYDGLEQTGSQRAEAIVKSESLAAD